MMFLEVLLPGKNTVDVGAATLLMVVFLGSEARWVTLTGMAVAYSMLPVFKVTVSSLLPPVFISSKMLEMESPMHLASWITTLPTSGSSCKTVSLEGSKFKPWMF